MRARLDRYGRHHGNTCYHTHLTTTADSRCREHELHVVACTLVRAGPSYGLPPHHPSCLKHLWRPGIGIRPGIEKAAVLFGHTWSQTFAVLGSPPQARLSELESGARMPNLLTILRLAVALDCKTDLVGTFDKTDLRALLLR